MHEKLISEIKSLSRFYHIKSLDKAANLLEEYELENQRLKWKLKELETENRKLRKFAGKKKETV